MPTSSTLPEATGTSFARSAASALVRMTRSMSRGRMTRP